MYEKRVILLGNFTRTGHHRGTLAQALGQSNLPHRRPMQIAKGKMPKPSRDEKPRFLRRKASGDTIGVRRNDSGQAPQPPNALGEA